MVILSRSRSAAGEWSEWEEDMSLDTDVLEIVHRSYVEMVVIHTVHGGIHQFKAKE